MWNVISFSLSTCSVHYILICGWREIAAESIYKERCIPVNDGPSWAKYMSISGSPNDEYDIITLQYTEEGLLSVDENCSGHSAAFGDDIAIESLATEFKREVYVVSLKLAPCTGYLVWHIYELDLLARICLISS